MDGELPSAAEVADRFGLYDRGAGGPSCTPEVGNDGAVSCSCYGCTKWKAYVQGGVEGEGGPKYEAR